MENSWRLLLSGAGEGHFNMAVDDILMESVREGGAPTLRLYTWSRPTLSLGRNQPARGLYATGELSRAGVEVVRRQTGGRAVLHHHELTYSVVLPDRAMGSVRTTYLTINERLVEAVRTLGVDARLHGSGSPAPALDERPCFAEPAPGEVVASGRKLIGSAQVRRQNVLLQHGSIPLERSPVLDALPTEISATIDGSAAYLRTLLPRPLEPGALSEAILQCWTRAAGELTEDCLTPEERRRIDSRSSFYLDDAWTWRR